MITWNEECGNDESESTLHRHKIANKVSMKSIRSTHLLDPSTVVGWSAICLESAGITVGEEKRVKISR